MKLIRSNCRKCMEIYKIYVTPIKRNFNYSLCIKEYKGNKNKTKYKTNIRKNH